MTGLVKFAATAIAVALMAFAAAPALAATTVDVTLSDMGDMGTMPTDAGLGMPGANPAKAMMKVEAATASVPAGEVTFNVTNKSAGTIHEMLVVKLVDAKTQLPYIAAENRVDEDKAGSLGEVSELDPGKSGTLTLTLTPGQYVLFCNIPGHFAAGMWTVLTVN